jgi:hypothetical protein
MLYPIAGQCSGIAPGFHAAPMRAMAPKGLCHDCFKQAPLF